MGGASASLETALRYRSTFYIGRGVRHDFAVEETRAAEQDFLETGGARLKGLHQEGASENDQPALSFPIIGNHQFDPAVIAAGHPIGESFAPIS